MTQRVQSTLGAKRLNAPRASRSGLSLLEVILAIAILGTSMAVIGQFFYQGYRSAERARKQSDATIICDSLMAEVAAGVIESKPVTSSDVPGQPNWQYSIASTESNVPGLLLTTVTVNERTNSRAVMSIVRFVPDPDFDPQEDR